ncbi:MAG: hypothetical protein AABY81_07135 [Pseudomonadota bacterium]
MAKAKKVSGIGSEEMSRMLKERNSFLLANVLAPQKARSITHWEEITCLGFNPQMQRMEAVVSIKQSTGYNGNLCSAASAEYVRFYVDFKDGNGFVDMGITSFKSADISNAPPGPQHPLCYMLYLYIDDEKYRRFIDCHTAVVPKMRAILSWKDAPTPSTPNYAPHYGNVRDADIQLQKRNFLYAKDVFELAKAKDLLTAIKPDVQIALKEPVPPKAVAIYESNKKVGIPDHRTFYSTVGSAIHSHLDFKQAAALYDLKDLAALKINTAKLLSFYNPDKKAADVGFEEVTCVGLNTDTDTLGAIVHIKKTSGYNGDLCHTGSMEHVAFWADWNNDGTFDQYLGTMSFEVHDIANMPVGGLFYNVALPIDVSNRLKSCQTPNIIGIRAVLSWESLPSTTDPDQLNTWGNSIDALVQLRPGASSGIHTIISLVGNVNRLMIDSTQHLYNYNAVAPTPNNNRPWGGSISFNGIIDRNGFNGVIKFRLSYKPYGTPDGDYKAVSSSETFNRWQPLVSIWPYTVSQTADSDGWYIYDLNPALGIYNIYDNNYLSHLDTSLFADGTYTIRFEYTDEFGNPVVGDVFSIVVCNKGMTVSQTANNAVDMTKDLDLVIDGGDCHSYKNSAPMINGHLRAVHPFFSSWALDLQPTSHTHGAHPVPINRSYSSLGDSGDSNASWSLDTTPLDPCGYTVSLKGHSRVILHSNPGYFPEYGPKAVGFAKLP